MKGRLPADQTKPSGHYHWELHDLRLPAELEGHQPTWVSETLLREAEFHDGVVHCGKARFTSLHVDCEWLDEQALATILRLVRQGMPLCLKRTPRQPGRMPSPHYAGWFAELTRSGKVADRFPEVAVRPPVLGGPCLPPHRCRVVDGELLVFLAHPQSRGLTYPMVPGQYRGAVRAELPVRISWQGRRVETTLIFAPLQSLVLRISRNGKIRVEQSGDAPLLKTAAATECEPV